MIGGQYGEDEFLQEYFKDWAEGFLVDVGAANGVDNSNSYHLLKRPGWGGILIEPEPSQYLALHNLYVDRENVECVPFGIGTVWETRILYCGGQVSTFKKDFKARCEKIHGIEYTETPTEMWRLENLLEDMKAPGHIDFLSIDCEGMDREVWDTLNQHKHRPRLVCLEGSNQILLGYHVVKRTHGNTFYERRSQL